MMTRSRRTNLGYFAFRRIPFLEFTVKSRGDFFHRTWRLKVLPVTNKSKQHWHQDQNRFTSLLLVTTGYVSLFRCRLCLQVVSQIWTGLETFGTGGEPSLPRRQDLEDDDDVATGGKGTNCWDIEVLWCLAWTWECWYCFDDFWMFLNHERDQRCRSRGMDLRLFGCQDLALGHLNQRWNKDKNSRMARTARMAHLTFHCRRHSLRKL